MNSRCPHDQISPDYDERGTFRHVVASEHSCEYRCWEAQGLLSSWLASRWISFPAPFWRHDSSSLRVSALLFALGILLLFAWSVAQFNRKSDAGPSRSRLPLTAWLGIGAILFGLPFYAGIQYWMDTRTLVSWGAYHDYDEIYGDVRLLSAMLSAIGLVLITRSFRQVCKPTQSKPKPAVSLNVAAGGHLSGRGLPPKTPFLTLPSFGFLYATFLCPILVFLVLTHTGPTPKVLFVFLLKPGSHIITNELEAGPLIVRIDAGNRWYLNSKRVQRE